MENRISQWPFFFQELEESFHGSNNLEGADFLFCFPVNWQEISQWPVFPSVSIFIQKFTHN